MEDGQAVWPYNCLTGNQKHEDQKYKGVIHTVFCHFQKSHKTIRSDNLVQVPWILAAKLLLGAMLLSQACFNAAFLMFLLWILYYVRLLSRAVQVREQQGNNRQQTSPAARQYRRRSEEHQNIEVVTNKKYPEEQDERPS